MDVRHQEIARCLFRESNDALFLFDPRDHRVADVNPAALRLTGFDKDVVCAMALGDLFTSAEPGGLERLIVGYRRTGFYHSREGYFLAREAGEPIPVNVSVSRIHTQPDPLGLVVARDISERIRAQEALRESENRYRSLVESAKVIIWVVSEDGRIASLNPAFESIVGWPCTAWVGRPAAELIHPDDLAVARDSLGRTLRGEAVPPFELRVHSAAGETLVLEIVSSARQAEGRPPAVSWIARDVTERRRAEEAVRRAEAMQRAKEAAETADRAKSEFLCNISHEIRTPMTAILGFTDLLVDDARIRALPPDLLEALRTIQHNGDHLLALINDLLDLNKIERSKLRVEPAPCSPLDLAREVAASLRPRAEGKGLALAVEPGPGVPATLSTDAVRLRQILMNLLSNAIKFTNEGGVRLEVRGEGAGPDRGFLRFEVVDTGVGISEADVGHLFEPFYTGESRTTRESGAGLGLAISRRLAELLGGWIDVRTRPGEGSTFTLTLPIGAERPDQAGVRQPGGLDALGEDEAGLEAPVARPLQGGRVLLAEDNPSIQRFLALRLRQSGAEVAVADNGREAVEQALEARDAGRPFDWILMDVQMPVMDGYEATRQLRGRGYRPPIIALTAYAIAEHREESQLYGCDDLVGKPVDWSQLLEVLGAHRGELGDPSAFPTPTPASP